MDATDEAVLDEVHAAQKLLKDSGWKPREISADTILLAAILIELRELNERSSS